MYLMKFLFKKFLLTIFVTICFLFFSFHLCFGKTKENLPAVNLSKLKIPIFMYHHIRNYHSENDPDGVVLSVSPENFANQLDLIIQKGFSPVTFEDLAAGRIPAKPVMLTFDDGRRNFYKNAFPELKKRKLKAVVYIIVGTIDKKNYLSLDEILEINHFGLEIGSHTLTHPILSALSRPAAQKEIIESKRRLEKIIGKTCLSFAYPYSAYNEEIQEIVKEAGYQFAVTMGHRVADFKNVYRLARYTITNESKVLSFLK